VITIILLRLWPIAPRHDDHDQPIIDLVQVPVGGSISEQDHGTQQSMGVIISLEGMMWMGSLPRFMIT
jgi:hypothetical protein